MMRQHLVFNRQEIEQNRKVVDEGLYVVTLTGFNQKMAKVKEDGSGGDSINYNPVLELTFLEDGKTPAPVRDDGKPIPIFANLNSKGYWVLDDFCHAFGLPMENIGPNQDVIPGIWVPESEQDIEKCTYKGPLVGRRAKVYLVKTDYKGTPQNKIKYFVCAVKDCAQKFPKIHHSDNLLKK